MSTQQLIDRARKHADYLQQMVQTYPQVSEDEPGGYCTEVDQCIDEAVGMLRQLAAELERLERKPQWLPIESAPTDGTRALIATDFAVGEARFLNDDDHEGWYWAQEHWTDAHVSGPEYPTHWMPLPAAPDIGEGEGK